MKKRMFKIEYKIGSIAASYKVRAYNSTDALYRFEESMQRSPITPSGERMWPSEVEGNFLTFFGIPSAPIAA